MNVYTAEKQSTTPGAGMFKHVGTSPFAAADRIEGMFAHQRTITFTSQHLVNVHNSSGHIIKTMQLAELLSEFCAFVRQFSIREYSVQFNKPLRLIDLWEDDPIGSAGPNVVDVSSVILDEKMEIQSLFSPFSGVIYPMHVYATFSRNEIKAIRDMYKSNALFQQEFKKRKARSRAIGEDFNQTQYQEIIWLDFTLKLRSWAIAKGYDAFVYSNTKEGDGSDTFITLLSHQLQSTGKSLVFLEEKYLREMPGIIKANLNRCQNTIPEVALHALWGQRNPIPYWAYT